MPYEGAADVAGAARRGDHRDEGRADDPARAGQRRPAPLADDLDRALRPIREIREAVGMEMQIANDAHAKWNLPIAIRIAQAMEPSTRCGRRT